MTRRLAVVRTLRTRVSLLALAVITAWLLILATGLSLVLVSRLNRQVNDGLRVRAQAASATVVLRGGHPVGVGESATDSELDSSIWVYRDVTAISQPPVGADLQRVADELAGTPAHFVDRHGRRFYVLPLLVHGRQVGSIVAAADLDPYERTKDTALIGVGIVAVLMLAGAYPVLRFATGRALRPVGEMTRQAAEWGVVAPDERFGGDQRYVELASLAKSLDGLLGRLAAVLRHERHASAELSHELRTPLSRVAAQVELLMDTASPAQSRELQEIRANCAAMDGIIDTLLAAARSELTGVVGRASVDAVLRSFAAPTGRPRTVVESAPLLVEVDDDLVARMLAPVVDNARRYAAATITMTARQCGTVVEIDVANDGPRLPHDLAERVFEPGFSARDGGHDGVGLGLALARRLARSADGDLVVEGSADHTVFRLTLPAG